VCSSDLALRLIARAGLDILADLYAGGADPAVIVEDMLELVHWLTRVKLVPEAADDPGMPEAERVRGRAMAETLPMATLTRSWQMLLKGLAEARHAPSPLQAAEMVLVRLVFAADLPSPAEAVAAVAGAGGAAAHNGGGAPSGGGGGAPSATASQAIPAMSSAPERPRAAAVGGQAHGGPEALPQGAPRADAEKPDPATFADVVALAVADREMILHANLTANLHLVRFEPGRIEFRPGEHAPGELAHDLSRFLNARTARRWVVTVSSEAGQPTLRQQEEAAEASRRSEAARHPLVRAVLETFPGAEIEAVRNLGGAAPQGGFEAALDAPPEPDAEDAD
jgi:DNA polymerase-3 subunit gamma/tau